MGLTGTDSNLRQEFKKMKLNKIQKILNFEFCLIFKSVSG